MMTQDKGKTLTLSLGHIYHLAFLPTLLPDKPLGPLV